MLTKDITIQHLETENDVEQHLELMRSVFGQNSRVDLQVRKWIEHHPTMTLKDFFVVKHRDKIVACLNLIPFRWSIGGIPLKVAELACVATLPEYRHHGLQRELTCEYHKRVSEEGYDLSVIEGIPYYYRQFGYEYALPLQEQTRIDINKMPDYKNVYAIRPFTGKDISRAGQLLAQVQGKFYVHSVRDEEIWEMQEETGMVADYEFEGFAVEEDEEMKGYFRTSENPESNELVLREITDVDQSMAQSIISFLKQAGKERGLVTLVATTGYTDSFTEHLMATGEARQGRLYAWQLRVTDYASMFLKMKVLFEKRLAMSTFRHLTGKLNFNFYRYTVQVSLEDGTVTDVRRLETNEDRTMRFNPAVFTQLLFGYRDRAELENVYQDFLVRPSHRHLIDVLFPKLPSYIHTDY
ncbi:hypothetical protein A3K79_02090 [Candidatus Bathyarchaeota archaeon RBG_13_46_16b]|nr:MAG: hypothetical protein A3K79_02090 [Candidatus Bathyarchaeota archaeon RBG_13_46_16b]